LDYGGLPLTADRVVDGVKGGGNVHPDGRAAAHDDLLVRSGSR
jgi:hypothetical protein